MQKPEEQLLQATEIIAQSIINQAEFDKTIQATIISCTDAVKGEYKVRYQGNSFYAYAADLTKTFKKGADVYINVPQNDFGKKKTIISAVGNIDDTAKIVYPISSYYNESGYDCLIEKNITDSIILNTKTLKKNTRGEWQPISLYKEGKYFQVLFLKENGDIVSTSYLSKVLLNDFRNGVNHYGSFVLRFDIISSINNDVEKDKYPRYGVRVSFKTEDGSVITEEFNSVNMTGNPYSYTNKSTQSRYFSYRGNLTITKVEVFGENFKEEDYAYISNLQLIPCQKLSEEEMAQRHLVITSLNGNTFSEEDNLTLEAVLREKGEIITLPKDKITYKWFLEQPSITTEDEDYNEYAGEGWIAAKNGQIEGQLAQWKYFKEDVKQFSRKVKCVLVYADDENNAAITYSAENILFNNDSKGNDFQIEYCLSEDKSNEQNWQKGTSIGLSKNMPYLYLRSTNPEGDGWVKKWTEKNAFDDLTILTDPDEDGILDIARSSLSDMRVFYCSYFKDSEYIGYASFAASAVSEDNTPYQLVILNPHPVFIYDEYGLAPTEKKTDKKVILKPLSVKIRDNKNNSYIEIGKEEVATNNITWYVEADRNERLILIEGELNPSTPLKEEVIDEVNYYGFTTPTLSFTLKPSYQTSSNSNNIKVKVTYDGLTLWGETSIECYKVGDPGTRSANEYCEIVLKGDNSSTWEWMPTLTYEQKGGQWNFNIDNLLEGESWFKARVWDGNEIIESTDENQESVTIKEWRLLGEKELSPKVEDFTSYQSFSIVDGKFNSKVKTDWIENFLSKVSTNSRGLFSLVQGRIGYRENDVEKTLYATSPLATVIKTAALANYSIQLVDNSGFKYIKYNSAGQQPQFDGTRPFQLLIKNNKNEDVSSSFNYNWKVYSEFYDCIERSFEETNLLKIEKKESSICKVDVKDSVEISSYWCYNAGVGCIIESGTDIVGYCFFPIDIYKMISDNSIVNDWDGYSLDLGTSGDQSYLMANMVGAGTKNDSGQFTGVLMGQITNMTGDTKTSFETGIMGYNDGSRSFFVNAEDGSTTLGIEKSGQIKIRPGKDPVIESGNFNDNQTGMQINFGSRPSIKYGNGNFKVDSEGKLTARGADLSSFKTQGELDDNLRETGSSFSLNEEGITLYSKQQDAKGLIKLNENPILSFVKYDTDGDIESGIIYEKGKLSITGEITATEGSIGGWIINKNYIKAEDGSLILYKDGRIIGSGDSKEDSENEDGWLDMSNKTLNWRVLTGTERIYDSDEGKYEDFKNITTLGTLTTDISGNFLANCSNSAIINGQNSSSLISGGSAAVVTKEKGFSVSEKGSSVFKSGLMESDTGRDGFLTLYQNVSADKSNIFGVQQCKKTLENPSEEDWGWTIRAVEGESSNNEGETKNKIVYYPSSTNEAIDFWMNFDQDEMKLQKEVDALNNLQNSRRQYRVSPVPVTKIVNIVGQAPLNVKLEKEGENYKITEFYDPSLFGGDSQKSYDENLKAYDDNIKKLEEELSNLSGEAAKQKKTEIKEEQNKRNNYEATQAEKSKNATLEYKIEMNGKEVKSLTFPNGQVMTLEGFEF